MKITRRQLRRIIKEADEYAAIRDKAKEAVFSIMYLTEYVQVYMEDLYNAIYDTLAATSTEPIISPIKTLTKLTNILTAAVIEMSNMEKKFITSYLDGDEADGIVGEAEDAAQFDFRESVYKPIEEINRFITQGTPIGMSVLDAVRNYQLQLDNKVGPIQAALDELMALMNDDQVLATLDQLDAGVIK